MARTDSNSSHSRSFALVGALAVVAALYFCREVLLPFALAILFSFLLAPLVDRLEKWRVPRVAAVLIAVSLCFASLGGLSYVLSRQLYDLAYNLPEYKWNIIEKAKAFQGDEDGVVSRATKAIKEVQENVFPEKTNQPAIHSAEERRKLEREKPTDDNEARPALPRSVPEDDVEQREPVRVEVVDSLSADKFAEAVLGPAFSLLGSAALVIVFVIFILLDREDLRDRMIHLMGSRQLNLTTQALGDASARVSRYLLMQLTINALFGLVISIGLYFIGLPNALLWGALATVLRFVPYIGPWIAAVMPAAVSLAIFDGWTRPILVVGLFVVNEVISNNVLEPWLYGASTGISSIGILVSAVFWAWLWGPLGLVMATPLTVCVLVLGRYVPELTVIRKLLSNQEVFPAPTRFYQRLLAMDPEEALDIAEGYREKHSLAELYDDVLMPALSLAEQDRHRGELDDENVQFIYTTLRELIEDFGGRPDPSAEKKPDAPEAASTKPKEPTPIETSVLCAPARDEADEIAGVMLAQLMKRRGVELRVLSTSSLTAEVLDQIDEQTAPLVCVSALPPHAALHARYLCKRLRPRFPLMKIVVGLWESGGSTRKAQDRLAELGVDKFVTTLAEAADQLVLLGSQVALFSNAAETMSPAMRRPTPVPTKHSVELR